jgi:hypothetical protein
MRLERRWLIAAAVALLVGALGAQTYAQLAAPYYRTAAAWIARGHPWTITRVDVAQDAARPGVFVRLHGEVRAVANAARPAAMLIGRVQAGAAIEGPLIFWTILLAWPGETRRRGALLIMGIPVFLGLEAATTVCQLLSGFADASAAIAGEPGAITWWERWSRFIESGGRDVLALCAALLTVAGARRLAPAVAARSTPWTTPAADRPTVEPAHRSPSPAVSRTPGFAGRPTPN